MKALPVALAGVALLALALADSHVRIVRLSYIAHGVALHQPQARAWVPALLDAPVVENQKIRTEAGGEAEIQFECGSAVRLIPSTAISVPRLSLRDDGVPATTIQVDEGTAFFSLRSADSRDFHVLAPDGATVVPAGDSSFRLDLAASGATEVALLTGSARVQFQGRSVQMKKGMAWSMGAGGAAQLVKFRPGDGWARWSRARDAAFQKALNAATPDTPFAIHAIEDRSQTAGIPSPTPSTLGSDSDPAAKFSANADAATRANGLSVSMDQTFSALDQPVVLAPDNIAALQQAVDRASGHGTKDPGDASPRDIHGGFSIFTTQNCARH